MVTTYQARRILYALADALPETGHDVLTAVEIRESWGDSVLVRIHTDHEHSPDGRALTDGLRAAADQALEGRRHRVEISWGSLGRRP